MLKPQGSANLFCQGQVGIASGIITIEMMKSRGTILDLHKGGPARDDLNCPCVGSSAMQRRLLGQLRTVNMSATPYGWLSSKLEHLGLQGPVNQSQGVSPRLPLSAVTGNFRGLRTKESG